MPGPKKAKKQPRWTRSKHLPLEEEFLSVGVPPPGSTYPPRVPSVDAPPPAATPGPAAAPPSKRLGASAVRRINSTREIVAGELRRRGNDEVRQAVASGVARRSARTSTGSVTIGLTNGVVRSASSKAAKRLAMNPRGPISEIPCTNSSRTESMATCYGRSGYGFWIRSATAPNQ